jgi:hypothetical protein
VRVTSPRRRRMRLRTRMTPRLSLSRDKRDATGFDRGGCAQELVRASGWS